jgi:pimeloyl-ACP methyl ester carboxylesterase
MITSSLAGCSRAHIPRGLQGVRSVPVRTGSRRLLRRLRACCVGAVLHARAGRLFFDSQPKTVRQTRIAGVLLIAAGLCLALTDATAAPARSGEAAGAGGVRIHYVDHGEKRAPALLFVPGWGMDASIWDAQIAAFSKSHRVIAIDPRSQGASGKTSGANTPEARAGDIDAVMRELALTRVVLVGWSQGVQDLAAYVDRFGTQRIAGLVLVDSPVAAGAAGITENPETARQTFERLAIYAAYPRQYLEGMMKAIFVQPMPDKRLQHLVETALKTPVSIGVSTLALDLYGPDRRAALKKIDKPTLVVAAATSPDLAAQQTMAEQVQGAKLVAIENAGHGVFVDQPERFNTALRDFLAGMDAGGRAQRASGSKGSPFRRRSR